MSNFFFRFIILSTIFQTCQGQTDSSAGKRRNYIDSINSAQQLTQLISKVDKKYKDFKINESLTFASSYSGKDYKKIFDSLKVQPWTKADFDNNGLTDILIIGTWSEHHILCILDEGDNHYEIKSITRRSFQECTFPVVRNNKIIFYFESYPQRGSWDIPLKLEHIILTYQFGDFIEENLAPPSHKIETIEYSTSGCFGTCPIFEMVINSDGTASWFAARYNAINKKEVKGHFTSRINIGKHNEIVSLLNYIDFSKLQNTYAVDWTDDQSSTLKITYDNGKTKLIEDYGLIGTYGLDRLYQMLFELRTNEKWTK